MDTAQRGVALPANKGRVFFLGWLIRVTPSGGSFGRQLDGEARMLALLHQC